LNLRSLDAAHRAHAASGVLVTLALVPNRHPDKYGGVRMQADGVVTGFVPRGTPVDDSYHFIGVQVVHADAFRQLPAGEPAGSIGGAYDRLIATRRGSVRGFLSDAAFWDIGTPEDLAQTSAELEEREKGVGSLFPERR
jgi:NDP-sugar pyrophosphorylase family protein